MSESYKECIKKASTRSDLSLCPRGYCTAKDKYKVYPSAYANGFAVKVCNGQQADADGKTKKEKEEESEKIVKGQNGGRMRIQKGKGDEKHKEEEGRQKVKEITSKGTLPNHPSTSKNIRPKQSGGKQNSLKRWFEEKWVNVCEKKKNGDYKPCGRPEATLKSKDYPYCRPLKKLEGTTVKSVNELSKKKLEQMCKKKQSIKPGVGGKPTRVMLKESE